MRGIVVPRPVGRPNRHATLARRLIARIERSFPDFEEPVDVGGGVHETRPEYRITHRRIFLRNHPNNDRVAIVFLTAQARTRFANLLSAIRAKLAGDRDEDERDALALPIEDELDATWDAT